MVDPAGLMRLELSMQVMRPTIPWLRKPNHVTAGALLTMNMADGHHLTTDLVTWMSLVGKHVKTSLAPRPLPDRTRHGLSATPIHVVEGADDVFLPPERLRRTVQRRLPGADLDIVAATGHLLPQPAVLHHLLPTAQST